MQPADGSSPPALLYSDVFSFAPCGWSPDGKVLAVTRSSPQGLDIYMLPLGGETKSGEKKPYPFLNGPGWKSEGIFSPDGKWFAYVSDESGRHEVYVVPFPGPGGRLQVSSGGGQAPNWLRGGHELAFVNGERKLVVAQLNSSGRQMQIGQSRVLFGGRALPVLPGGEAGSQGTTSVYLTPDGTRIVLAVPTDYESVKPLTLITNWTDGLSR